MKIKSIKYRNFRNFGREGEVNFDTDGRMTIVYGTNGDGKTTFHQLFQWILYGKTSFNKTTSSTKLYNLRLGSLLEQERGFTVWGQIEFEHLGFEYVVRREWYYYKNKSGQIQHKSDNDSFYVQVKNDNNDWVTVDQPEHVIESVLPSGLSPYFFFDGETMIADLKMRGSESAKSLRTALNTIFDLTSYQKALNDLGNINKSSSVLGKLDKERRKIVAETAKTADEQQYAKEINILTKKLEVIDEEDQENVRLLEKYEKRLESISEEIGTNKSRKHLEEDRQTFKTSITSYEESIKREQLKFGKEIEENFAYLLVSSVANDADQRMYLKVQDEKEKIIPGLTKELLIHLLKQQYDTCICGNKIRRKELNRLEEWKSFFPPASYKSTYDKFQRTAARFSREFKEYQLFSYLTEIVKIRGSIKKAEDRIEEIDEELKNCGNIDDLLNERRDIEKRKQEVEQALRTNEGEKRIALRQKNQREKALAGLKKKNGNLDEYEERISLVQDVKELLEKEMNEQTIEYSKQLEEEIQLLIEKMLTSKRTVQLNEDFQLQVKDSFMDESKSEGQFAVVSFAYIGGILKVLKEHERFDGKEYPLILDGPFSKLDEVQKKNVLDTIPQYAPQVVIFSKDPLTDFIDKDTVGKVWTIVSNDEKNYAEIKEGYLWN